MDDECFTWYFLDCRIEFYPPCVLCLNVIYTKETTLANRELFTKSALSPCGNIVVANTKNMTYI